MTTQPAGSTPRLLLKIINENRDQYDTPKSIDTKDRRQHLFRWNTEVGAYCNEPPDQAAIDQILELNWTFPQIPWRYSVVWVGGGLPAAAGEVPMAKPGSAFIPPFVRQELYASYPLDDLKALCRDCGFPIQGNAEDEHNLKSQLAAYYVGRAWAVEELRRARESEDEMRKRVEALPILAEPMTTGSPSLSYVPALNVVTPEMPTVRKKRARVRVLNPALA